MLSEEQIQEFIREGVLVIPNVLTEEEVYQTRKEFHHCLAKYGVLHEDLQNSAHNLVKLSSTHGSGGILDLFHFEWKLMLNEHPKIVSCIQELWKSTYASFDEEIHDKSHTFYHPYSKFNPDHGYMYIDRVCYRIPTNFVHKNSSESKKKNRNIQRSLTPHLDCCPDRIYDPTITRKWRPIQCFIALTDTLEANEGGFEACPRLHSEFNTWKENRARNENDNNPAPCVGQFTPIRPKEDADIIARMRHIPCKAGDLVCWDFRIAHANSLYNHKQMPSIDNSNSNNDSEVDRATTIESTGSVSSSGSIIENGSRECVYIGLLPAIPLNHQYAADQLEKYRNGILPNDQWHSAKDLQHCDHQFSELGRKLMSIDPWE